jgi:putative ABC transport system substrate-binding protein
MKAAARQSGFSIEMAECTRPGELIPAFLSLRERVDFIWCLPDSDLYNSATVKPLVIASLTNRLPIIGFSESFVQAGAVLGVYPDFEGAGRQTGELVKRYLAGAALPPNERLKSIRASFNLQVARLLGLRPAPGYPAGVHPVSAQ